MTREQRIEKWENHMRADHPEWTAAQVRDEARRIVIQCIVEPAAEEAAGSIEE